MKPTKTVKPWNANVTVVAYEGVGDQIDGRFDTFLNWYHDQCALLKHFGAFATGLWGNTPAVCSYLETVGLREMIEHGQEALAARMAAMPAFPQVWPEKFAGEYLVSVRQRLDQMDGFVAPDLSNSVEC